MDSLSNPSDDRPVASPATGPASTLLPGPGGADPALAADEALAALLEWRQGQLRRILGERIAVLRRPFKKDGRKARAGDREEVHQLRTGLRRLRSMAEAFP
ncbi:MAG: hypothetical protein WBN89_12535, partial [Prochlorococcaceae cyanobacterium]